MPSCHHAIMSPCHHAMSSCHQTIMPSCHHTIMPSFHHATIPSCHHTIMPSCPPYVRIIMPSCHHATMPQWHDAIMPPCHIVSPPLAASIALLIPCPCPAHATASTPWQHLAPSFSLQPLPRRGNINTEHTTTHGRENRISYKGAAQGGLRRGGCAGYQPHDDNGCRCPL